MDGFLFSISKLLVVGALLFVPGASERFRAGLKAYQEGRFNEALAEFSEAEKAAGDKASAELLFNQALSALRAGELASLESSAEKSAARGGEKFAPLRDFLLGNSAFARSEKAEAIAKSPEGEPSAFTDAITQAETAKNFWQQAAASRPDWPEARRNVERALLKIEQLKKEKEEADKKKQKDKEQDTDKDKDKEKNKEKDPQEQKDKQDEKDSEPKPDENKDDNKSKPEEKPPEPKKDDSDSKQAKTQAQKVELSPEQLRRLFEKLDEKERQKLALRKAQQQSKKTRVEKDW